MSVGLIFFVISLILLSILFGLSIGVAFLLHWLLPAVGMEMALLIAVIAVGQTLLICGRLFFMLPPPNYTAEEDSDPPPVIILDREINLPRRRQRRR